MFSKDLFFLLGEGEDMLFPDYANAYSVNNKSTYTIQENCLVYINILKFADSSYPVYLLLNGKKLSEVLSSFLTGFSGEPEIDNTTRIFLFLKKGDTLKCVNASNASYGYCKYVIIPLVKLGWGVNSFILFCLYNKRPFDQHI